jgi:hypothetical protein
VGNPQVQNYPVKYEQIQKIKVSRRACVDTIFRNLTMHTVNKVINIKTKDSIKLYKKKLELCELKVVIE